MKKLFLSTFLMLSLMLFVGCVPETKSEDKDGNQTREFKINETAIVNKTEIKINNVKKILKECLWEYAGECQSFSEPDGDFYLLVDLSITNKNDDDLNISSMLSFELKSKEGEKGSYAFLTNSIKSQLDGSVMPGDLLKGQIAFDVNDSEEYYFYYKDSLLDSSIKFIIKKSDITD